ncbi:unnamed protein product [Adineta steineri]|uniref:Choline kinase n=1 Tax=Adineta steineri TaxID=433720 RepID=A0A819C5H1_9BILA|nr:unnamed protein product [Adineta steineri]CAF3813240.1 unnamed protein product [Adineta steineri]
MWSRKSATPLEKVTPDQALEWCQNFLRGAWSTISVEQLRLERVSGGLSNYLYCCSLPDDIELQGNEPRKVFLRIYGEAHQQHRSTLLIDSVVCTLLSDRKIGPHVHGIFPQGRIEEFVEAESLVVSELFDPKISQKNGHLLSELHQLDMPLVKEPIWLYHSIDQFLSSLPTDLHKFEIEEDRHIYQEFQSICKFTEEFEQLKTILAKIDSPIQFCHNDFQPGNILRLKSQPDNFTVIDFEYCSYNYRGYDIGNHFCEHMFNYVFLKEWPFFTVDYTLYPTKEQQVNFLSAYVDRILAAQDQSVPCTNDSDNDIALSTNNNYREELINQIIKEANYYTLASHFFWSLWAINMAMSTAIKFGYMEYARARLTAYYLTREKLLNGNEMPPKFDEDLLRSTKNPFHASYIKTNSKQLPI